MVESIPWVKHIGLGAEQQYSTIGSKLITIMTFRCSDIQIVHHSESDNTSHLTWNARTLAGYFAPSKGGVSLERRGYITSPYRKETSEGRLTKEIRWPRLSFAEVIHTSCAYKHQRKKVAALSSLDTALNPASHQHMSCPRTSPDPGHIHIIIPKKKEHVSVRVGNHAEHSVVDLFAFFRASLIQAI